METVRTLKLRIKDKHAKAMLAMARDVNTVWNFCNETQYRSLQRYCNRPKVLVGYATINGLTGMRGKPRRSGLRITHIFRQIALVN